MGNFDYDYYIKRNEENAKAIFGKSLVDRHVEGTDIYFDSQWRMHKKDEIKRKD